MTGKRENVSPWDDTFMEIASVISKRSKDPSTQVGACIVASDRRILSLGYNGTPVGFDDDEFPWSNRDLSDPVNCKYSYVMHAERNAILNYRGSLKEFENSTIYITHYPCHECAKEVTSVGIGEVVYLNDWALPGSPNQIQEKIFKNAGVTLRKFEFPKGLNL